MIELKKIIAEYEKKIAQLKKKKLIILFFGFIGKFRTFYRAYKSEPFILRYYTACQDSKKDNVLQQITIIFFNK